MSADQKIEEMFNSSSEFELFEDGFRKSETPEYMCRKVEKMEEKPEDVVEPLSVRIMKAIQPKIDNRQNMLIIFDEESDKVTIQNLAPNPTSTKSFWTYIKETFVTENVKAFFKIAIPVLVLRYMFKMHWRLIKIENSIGKFRRL